MNASFLPAAQAELIAAVQWYLADGGPVPAETFEAAIRRATHMLSRMPTVGTPMRGGLRSWPLRRFPYTLVYRSLGDQGIEVIALAHHKREHGYWAGRR